MRGNTQVKVVNFSYARVGDSFAVIRLEARKSPSVVALRTKRTDGTAYEYPPLPPLGPGGRTEFLVPAALVESNWQLVCQDLAIDVGVPEPGGSVPDSAAYTETAYSLHQATIVAQASQLREQNEAADLEERIGEATARGDRAELDAQAAWRRIEELEAAVAEVDHERAADGDMRAAELLAAVAVANRERDEAQERIGKVEAQLEEARLERQRLEEESAERIQELNERVAELHEALDQAGRERDRLRLTSSASGESELDRSAEQRAQSLLEDAEASGAPVSVFPLEDETDESLAEVFDASLRSWASRDWAGDQHEAARWHALALAVLLEAARRPVFANGAPRPVHQLLRTGMPRGERLAAQLRSACQERNERAARNQ